MITRAQELYNKWMDGVRTGFPTKDITDDEVNELATLLASARDLSVAFKAGNACTNYFTQIWYNVEQVRNARGLK